MPGSPQDKTLHHENSGNVEEDSAEPRPTHRKIFRWVGIVLSSLFLLSVCAGSWLYWKYHVDPPAYVSRTPLPQATTSGHGLAVQMPNGNLVGLIGTYDDELTAYLRLQYFRSLTKLQGAPILMDTNETVAGPVYRIYVVLSNDLLSQSIRLADLQIHGYISSFETDSPPSSEIDEWEKKTRVFDATYQGPVRARLLHLPRRALTLAVAHFILFKTETDRRVREHLEPAMGKTLSAEDARQFAADMIDVAEFYQIPLDMLLGIGAMENNYLDVQGDLKHSIWKKHAQHGDIVLRRRKGRVLVSNYSLGPWQITRETLRYVHALYLHDKRDYSKLPERLRPPRSLDLDQVDAHVLTTYAGLLLRQLMDYFDGDIVKAQGAYNGGAGKPNLHYSEGVSMVSTYAHRVLSMAAGRKGNAVAQTPMTVTNHRGEEHGIADRFKADLE